MSAAVEEARPLPATGSAAAGPDARRRWWELSEHAAHALLIVMFVVKVGVTAWNAHAYRSQSYDYHHHLGRALVGGLVPGKMNYDPPLYYLPVPIYRALTEQLAGAAPTGAQLEFRVMHFLRVTNVLYIALFYACWCFFSFPRLLPDWRSSFLASALLMSLPGYQKLAAMTHADNLFAASAALCTAVWLAVHERYLARGIQLEARYWLGLAAAAGVVGLSRPFAVVPVGLFALVAATFALRGRRMSLPRAAGRLLVIGAIAGSLAVAWYGYRWRASTAVLDAYEEEYMAPYLKGREGFDFVHYFTSFGLPELLESPNRKIPDIGGALGNNSFFTVLYSEVWGDHWLYFSGKRGVEGKLWPKRILFVAALPVIPWLLYGTWRSLRACRERARQATAGARSGLRRLQAALAANERQVVLSAWLLSAVGLYLYWQTGPALLPGKNSTIKFIYTATFYPLVIALAAGFRPSRGLFNASAYYLTALFVASLPVAIFVMR